MNDNIIHANFDKFGILRSHFAQERAIQILDRASQSLPAGRAREIIERAVPEIPYEEAWVCLLFDAAVNTDLFIRQIVGDEIVYGDGDDAVRVPLGEVFKAADRVLLRLSEADNEVVWDLAENTLESATRSMLS